jgi:hypothetical protein
MESQTIIIISVLLVIIINVVATILFFKRTIGNTPIQKLFQLIIIWCIPIIGAILIIMLRKSLNEPLLSAKENEKARTWRESNKKEMDGM